MDIQKRSLNWLPRASVYAENEAARAKRRSNLATDTAASASLNSTLISTGTSTTGDAINLTLRIAAARIQKAAISKTA